MTGPVAPAGAAPVGFFAARKTLFQVMAVPAALIAILIPTLLLGSTSHKLHTGSVVALEAAATENLSLDGVNAAHAEVAAAISKTNQYWGRFFIGPSEPQYASSVPSVYGFAHFELRYVTPPDGIGTVKNYSWVVIAQGATDVGCPSGPASERVPLSVIESFGLTCPTT